MKAFSTTEIEEYVNGLTDFQKKAVLEMREAVLGTDERIKEGMKWSSIAFFNQKNICGYRIAKQHITLLFMEGASLNDTHTILTGNGAKARTYKVSENDTVNSTAISELVKQCLDKGF